MKRILATAVALAAVTLAGADASAQEAPVAPVVAVPNPSTVRVHFKGYRSKTTARVYSHRTDDSWVMVCQTPCTVDVPVGAELRITIPNYEDEPNSYIVPGDVGPEIDVEVKPASIGPVVGGIVMLGTGGATMLAGVALLAIADFAGGRGSDDAKTVAYVCMGIGAASAGGGLLWLLTRSHEPRTTDKPSRRSTIGRADAFLDDAAFARPRDPSSSVPPPFAPVRFGFTF